MTVLTTHVLDLANGCPASGVAVEVFFLEEGTEKKRLAQAETNEDGRVNRPLVSNEQLITGEYELLFKIGDYFKKKGMVSENPPFLNCVSVRVSLSATKTHYHIPLLVSPWGYQVYRGS